MCTAREWRGRRTTGKRVCLFLFFMVVGDRGVGVGRRGDVGGRGEGVQVRIWEGELLKARVGRRAGMWLRSCLFSC